jgi:uncharacterized glyoxalase superfamily protein PhnB
VNPIASTSIRFDSVAPQFTVPDVVHTAQYYRDVLGFEIAGYWDGEQVHLDAGRPAVFGIVRRDQTRLHFNRADQSDLPTSRAEGAYDVYFHVTGVDELAEELSRRGADILDGPEDRAYAQRELIVRDCNGLILAFGEDTSQLKRDPLAHQKRA